MQVAGDVLSFSNVWRNQNLFYNITDHINTNYFHCRDHQSPQSGCTLRVRYLKQIWSRGHNVRGQGLKKNPRPKPRTGFSSKDPLEAKGRIGRGQSQGPRTKLKKNYGRQTLTVFKRESVRHCILLSFS